MKSIVLSLAVALLVFSTLVFAGDIVCIHTDGTFCRDRSFDASEVPGDGEIQRLQSSALVFSDLYVTNTYTTGVTNVAVVVARFKTITVDGTNYVDQHQTPMP